MDSDNPIVFLRKYLVVVLCAIIAIVLGYILGSDNLFTSIVSALLLMIMLFMMLYYFVSAFGNAIKFNIMNREKFHWLHIVNVILTVFLFIVYMNFYLTLFAPILFSFL